MLQKEFKLAKTGIGTHTTEIKIKVNIKVLKI